MGAQGVVLETALTESQDAERYRLACAVQGKKHTDSWYFEKVV